MDEELKQYKSVLRSLVVSSATQVDVRTLLRDYRTMVGKHLPYAKYGYNEPITFLKEHFSDCFLFQGPVTNPVLVLIVPDSLKHIDKFVQKQKVNNVKLKGKRRSVHEATVKPVYSESNLIAKTFVERSSIIKSAPKINNSKINLQNDKENVNTQSLLEPPSPVKEKDKCNAIIQENGTGSQNALQIFLRKRTPLYNSSLSVSDKESPRDDGDSGRLTSSSTSSKKIQMEQLHREIKEIIMENPNGVWCTDLLRLYRARYNRELNFSRLGYTSVLSVVSALDGVHMSRRALADDWLLTDATRPTPPAAYPAPRAPPRATRRPPPAPADPDDALPGIDFEPDVFPADCLHFLESIPGVSLADVAPGDMLEVAVAEVYSPSHFWLLRLGEEYDIAMEDTMDDMNDYYERGDGKDRRLASGAVRPGHYCASIYDGDWHRSIIVRVLDSDTVKVRHVDYGTVERVAAASLRALPRRFAALPAQAVRARLAAARPPAAGRRWPHAASHHFLTLVRDRRLVANVVAAHAHDRALEVLLIDTTAPEDRCVAAELVRAGHADPRPEPVAPSATSECYLFPRFEALESGATPSFAELHAYLRDGIALDFVHDYRRHVPPCLPPCPPPCLPSSPAISESTRPHPSPPLLSAPAHIPAPDAPRMVSLSTTDCEAFALLSRVDACAAQRFMLEALSRALAAAPSPAAGLSPAAGPSLAAGPSPAAGPSLAAGRSPAAGPSPAAGLSPAAGSSPAADPFPAARPWLDPEAMEFRPLSSQMARVRPPPGFESGYYNGS